MSKAEKFIQNWTRNCSNVCSYNSLECEIPWLTPDQARRAVEIAREEIYKWLENNLSAYDACDNSIEKNRLLKELKQAMKDE